MIRQYPPQNLELLKVPWSRASRLYLAFISLLESGDSMLTPGAATDYNKIVPMDQHPHIQLLMEKMARRSLPRNKVSCL